MTGLLQRPWRSQPLKCGWFSGFGEKRWVRPPGQVGRGPEAAPGIWNAPAESQLAHTSWGLSSEPAVLLQKGVASPQREPSLDHDKRRPSQSLLCDRRHANPPLGVPHSLLPQPEEICPHIPIFPFEETKGTEKLSHLPRPAWARPRTEVWLGPHHCDSPVWQGLRCLLPGGEHGVLELCWTLVVPAGWLGQPHLF